MKNFARLTQHIISAIRVCGIPSGPGSSPTVNKFEFLWIKQCAGNPTLDRLPIHRLRPIRHSVYGGYLFLHILNNKIAVVCHVEELSVEHI